MSSIKFVPINSECRLKNYSFGSILKKRLTVPY